MHRLGSFIQATIGKEFADFTYCIGFEMVIHGHIWMFPVAGNAEALEFFTLHIDLPPGIFAAFTAEFGVGNIFFFTFFLLELLFNLQFNRQAMTIPARDVRRIEPHHGA